MLPLKHIFLTISHTSYLSCSLLGCLLWVHPWYVMWRPAHCPLPTIPTENWELSWCQLCHHWWHHRLSSWQSVVPPLMTKLASWSLWQPAVAPVMTKLASWSLWQPAVPPLMTKSAAWSLWPAVPPMTKLASWHLSVFSVITLNDDSTAWQNRTAQQPWPPEKPSSQESD